MVNQKEKSNNENSKKLIREVLVVEDSPAERFLLSERISKLGYKVIQAEDGIEAIVQLQQNNVSIVVSDWIMPGVSGIELCQEIKNRNFDDPYFILLTGKDSIEDLVQGMEAGADDFIAKPCNSNELRVRLKAGERVMEMRESLENKNNELKKFIKREKAFNKRTRNDLCVASDMILNLLPDTSKKINNIGVSGYFSPASEIGGDFYNYFPLDDDHVGFYILDVCGHGIASALFSFTLARTILPYPKEISFLYEGDKIKKPSEVVQYLNNYFNNKNPNDQYFTMVYGVLNINNGVGSFCQAGHPAPTIVGNDGKITQLGGSGFPVGLLPGVTYEDTDFILDINSRLVLTSDGLIECFNQDGEQFGSSNLEKLMTSQSDKSLSEMNINVEKTFDSWSGGKEQSDDMTLLVIERLESVKNNIAVNMREVS